MNKSILTRVREEILISQSRINTLLEDPEPEHFDPCMLELLEVIREKHKNDCDTTLRFLGKVYESGVINNV